MVTYIDFTLPDHLENLVMYLGSQVYGHGNSRSSQILRNALSNSLAGFDGNDRIESGAGNDVMDGGNGNDVLVGGHRSCHHVRRGRR